MAVEIVGWCATAVNICIAFPQFLRLMRTRDTAGISVLFWQLNLGICPAWITYGVLIDAMNLVTCNVVMTVMAALVLRLIRQSLGVSVARLVLPGAAMYAMLMGTYIAAGDFGGIAFGALASVLQVLANSGQSIDLVRAPKVTGVSPVFLALANANQVLWFTWAILADEPGMVICSGVTEVVVGFSLVWLFLRSRGMRAFFPYDTKAEMPDTSAALS